MENLHDWINSGILVIMGVLIFSQNNVLKYMKTALETINPEKIKQAQDFINEGTEHKYRQMLDVKLKEHIHEASIRFQETNKDFLAEHNELIHFIFSVLHDKDWQYREKHFEFYPKNADKLRNLLELYDKGEFDPRTESNNHKNTDQ